VFSWCLHVFRFHVLRFHVFPHGLCSRFPSFGCCKVVAGVLVFMCFSMCSRSCVFFHLVFMLFSCFVYVVHGCSLVPMFPYVFFVLLFHGFSMFVFFFHGFVHGLFMFVLRVFMLCSQLFHEVVDGVSNVVSMLILLLFRVFVHVYVFHVLHVFHCAFACVPLVVVAVSFFCFFCFSCVLFCYVSMYSRGCSCVFQLFHNCSRFP